MLKQITTTIFKTNQSSENLSYSSSSVVALFKKGDNLFHRGEYAEAIPYFIDFIKQYTEKDFIYWDAYHACGCAHLFTNEPSFALPYFIEFVQNADKENPEIAELLPSVYLAQGVGYLLMGKSFFVDAMQSLEQALNGNQENAVPKALFYRGILKFLNNDKDAEKDIKQALELNAQKVKETAQGFFNNLASSALDADKSKIVAYLETMGIRDCDTKPSKLNTIFSWFNKSKEERKSLITTASDQIDYGTTISIFDQKN